MQVQLLNKLIYIFYGVL